MENKVSAFEKRCIIAARDAGVEVIFFRDDVDHKNDAVEDDGSLHVTRSGLRACFDVGDGQSRSGYDQNVKTIMVLSGLGLWLDMEQKSKDRVLVDETAEEDDDDECPHCGMSRSGNY